MRELRDALQSSVPAGSGRGLWLRSIALRCLGTALVWLALTGADAGAWRYGVAVVALVVALSLWLLPPKPQQASLWRVLLLVPVLAWYSLLGGIDVALRAMGPTMPLDPDLIEVPLANPDGPAAIALAFVLTLLPGSLVATVDGRGLQLHVIDRRLPNALLAAKVERWLRWALEAG